MKIKIRKYGFLINRTYNESKETYVYTCYFRNGYLGYGRTLKRCLKTAFLTYVHNKIGELRDISDD